MPGPSNDPAALRADIEARYGSVHRFCRLTGLNRSTVYWLLAGKYPGNVARQVARIHDALEGVSREEAVFRAIKSTACRRCGTGKSELCRRCDSLYRAQAQAVLEVMGG